MSKKAIFVGIICLFLNILSVNTANALDLHNFDSGMEGWYINQRGQFFPYGNPQLSWTNSIDYKDNPSSGALQLDLDLQGSEGIFDATIIQSADWGLPGQKTWNLSSYEYIHAMVYIPEGGPPELEAVVFSKSGEGWVWSQSDWTPLIAGKWNKLSLPIERIAAPSKVHAFGVKVGGDLSYQGAVFIDGIHATAPVQSIGFDFDVRGFADTALGFTSVIVAPYDTSTGHGYESTGNINGILRNPGDPLTRDCHYSWSDATFLVDLPDADYEVKIHFGDLYIPTDEISIYAEGELKFENISTAPGEYRTESFEVTVNDGHLNLTFHDEGGVNNLWIINGIEVIPPDTTPPVTSADPPGGTYYFPQGIILRADEPATIYYTIDGSEPTVDSPVYTDPINIFATTTINFFGIDASGKVESPYNTENYVIQSSTSNLLFDFECRGYEDTAPGFTSVFVINYDSGSGYGYVSTDSTNNILRYTTDPLRRDSHYGWADKTFLVDLPDVDYQVHIFFGDLYIPTDNVSVYAEGELKLENISTASGEYRSESFDVTVNDGQLNLTFHDEGGQNNLWIINGIVIIGPDTEPPITSADPPGGTYSAPQTVTLSANEPATIYYTTDGSDPSTSSNIYTAPIQINPGTTLNFFGVDEAGNVETPYNTEDYIFTPPAPYTFSISENMDPVSRYEKLELQVSWDGSGSYSNPFDPDEVSLWGIFTSPDGAEWQIPGFWNGSDWLIRFSPHEEGLWSYSVKVEDYAGTNESGEFSFSCAASTLHGWLRVSENDPHYLRYDDETSFLGIGHNRAWFLEQLEWNPDTGYQLLIDMETYGMNILGFWMAPWDTQLVTLSSGYDRYDMNRANILDAIIEGSEEHGIHLVLAIWAHDALRCGQHHWGSGHWDENPFSDLGTCDEFFTDETMWEYQEKLYRYIIARWGYSQAIGVWHTICEIEGTGSSAYEWTDKNYWHEKITNYFQQNDPFDHPTSGSNTHYSDLWPEGYSAMDMPQIHVYEGTNNPIYLAERIHYWTDLLRDNYQKPVFIGEFGTSNESLQPDHIHNGVWAGLASGGAITPLDWNDGGAWGDMSPDMFDHMVILADFVADIEFDKLSLNPATISIESCNAWAMSNNSYAFGWILDPNSSPITSGKTLTLTGLKDGLYDIVWWDTRSGDVQITQANCMAGTLQTTIPDFSKDVAFKIQEIDDVTPPATTADPSGGTYDSAQTVTLSANEPATIYYTLDGTDPTTSSPVYSTPLMIEADSTLKFFGVDIAGNIETPFHIEEYTFTIMDTTPPVTSADPSGGTYDSAQTVTLSANEPATIYYTLDGTDPTTSSPVYSTPLMIEADSTLKFFGVDVAGNIESPFHIEEYTFTIMDTTPPVTSADPHGGIYNSSQTVVLSANEPATIYYTLDGTDPTTSSTVYSTPLIIEADSTLKFFGVDIAGNIETPFHIEEYTFTIMDTTPPVTSADLPGGTYDSSQTVTLSADEPVTIYYTIDGTDPTTSSPVYSAPLMIEADTTLKFFGVDTAGNTETPFHLEQYSFEISLTKLDFDVRGFLDTAPGYSSLTVTAYNPTTGFGYESTININGILRNPGNPLTRDCHYSWGDGTLLVDLPDGNYQITVHLGELYIPTDDLSIYAEGELKLENISTSSGEYRTESFEVSVNDGQLDLVFHDAGGQNSLWIINGIEIIHLASSQLLSLEQLGGVTAYGDYYWYDASNDAPNSNWGNPYTQDFVDNFNYGDNNENTGDGYDYQDSSATLTYNYSNPETFGGTLNTSGLKPNFAYQIKLFADGTDEWTLEQIGYSGRWWKIAPDGTGSNATDSEYESFKNGTGFAGYTFNSYRLFDYLVTDQFGNASLGFDVDSSYHVLWKKVQRERGLNDSPYTSHDILNPPDSWIYDGTIPEKTVQIYAENERGTPGAYPLPSGTYRYVKLIMTEESWHHEWKWASAMGSPYFQFEVTE